MNWVGGARSRVKQKVEKGFQWPTYNQGRLKNIGQSKRPRSRSPMKVTYEKKCRDVSQDLIGLKTLSDVHEPINDTQKSRAMQRPVMRVYLDKPNNQQSKNYDIELPMSPISHPSALEFLDTSTDTSFYAEPPRVSTLKRTARNTTVSDFDQTNDFHLGDTDLMLANKDKDMIHVSAMTDSLFPVKQNSVTREKAKKLAKKPTQSCFSSWKADSSQILDSTLNSVKPTFKGNTHLQNNPDHFNTQAVQQRKYSFQPPLNAPLKPKLIETCTSVKSVLDTEKPIPITNLSKRRDETAWWKNLGWYNDSKKQRCNPTNENSSELYRAISQCSSSSKTNDRETPFSLNTKPLDVDSLISFHRSQNSDKPTVVKSSMFSIPRSGSTACEEAPMLFHPYEHKKVPNYSQPPESESLELMECNNPLPPKQDSRLINFNPNKPRPQHQSSIFSTDSSQNASNFETETVLGLTKHHPILSHTSFEEKLYSEAVTPDNPRPLSAFEKMIVTLECEESMYSTPMKPAEEVSLGGTAESRHVEWMKFITGEDRRCDDSQKIADEEKCTTDSLPKATALRLSQKATETRFCLPIESSCDRHASEDDPDGTFTTDEKDLSVYHDNSEIVLSQDEDIYSSPDFALMHLPSFSKRKMKGGKSGNTELTPVLPVNKPSSRQDSYKKLSSSSNGLNLASNEDICEEHNTRKDQLVSTEERSPIKCQSANTVQYSSCPTQTEPPIISHTGTQTLQSNISVEVSSQTDVSRMPGQKLICSKKLILTGSGGQMQTSTGHPAIVSKNETSLSSKDAQSNCSCCHDVSPCAFAHLTVPDTDLLLEAFDTSSKRIVSAINSASDQGFSNVLRFVEKEFEEMKRLTDSITNDLVYRSLMLKLGEQ